MKYTDENSIRLDEIQQRGAYCTKCDTEGKHSRLKLITNCRLDHKYELMTICTVCDDMTRTLFINQEEL